jgi:membrane protease YdiL (CAAX protease family)
MNSILGCTIPDRGSWTLLDCLWVLLAPVATYFIASVLHAGFEARWSFAIIVFLAGSGIYISLFKDIPLSEMGLNIKSFAPTWSAMMIIGGPLSFTIPMAMEHVSYRALLGNRLWGVSWRLFNIRALLPEDYKWFLLIILFVLGEEVMFRGFLLTTLIKPLGNWSAIICQGCLFGCLHYFGWNKDAVLPAAISGICFGWVVRQSKSLWPAITGHAAIWVFMCYLCPA